MIMRGMANMAITLALYESGWISIGNFCMEVNQFVSIPALKVQNDESQSIWVKAVVPGKCAANK